VSAPAVVDALTAREFRRRVKLLRAWVPANVGHVQSVLSFASGWARGSETANQTLIDLGTSLAWVHDEHELLTAGRGGPVPDPLVRLGALVRGEVQRQLFAELVAVVRARR
jgi:hypothetical protein